jgi:succinate dehydrogenase / fumarate reductase cytochrome b subunit
MGGSLSTVLNSSIVKKQIVAITGLMMVGFIVAHMAGNWLILVGPEAFNGYAAKLQSLGAILWIMRLGMIAAFVLHIYFTIRLTGENHAARGGRYHAAGDRGRTTFVKKTMIYSGVLVLAFVLIHLKDYTLTEHAGQATVIPTVNAGKSLGLYGLVWNSFLLSEHWWRPLLYVVAVCCVGAHLSHGVQSLVQTVGFFHERYTPLIQKISIALGVIVAVGFSVIPIYVNIVKVPSL